MQILQLRLLLAAEAKYFEAYCPYQIFAVRFSQLALFKGVWQSKVFEKDTPHDSSLSAESRLPPH